MNNFLLADDQGIIRSGIKMLIKENFIDYRIDEAANELEIVKLVKDVVYDGIILDINMPDTDFVKLMEWLNKVSSTTRILVFTMHPEDIYGTRCFQLGARGFLRKTASNEEIVFAISRVLEGRKYINPVMAELLLENSNGKKKSNPFQNLSSRELEIAMLLNKGSSLPEICNILNIEYSTVNTHKRKIFEKLMVKNLLSLTRMMAIYSF